MWSLFNCYGDMQSAGRHAVEMVGTKEAGKWLRQRRAICDAELAGTTGEQKLLFSIGPKSCFLLLLFLLLVLSL